MRMFEGDVSIEPQESGALKVIFKSVTGETVATEIPEGRLSAFRRAVVIGGTEDEIAMSAIKEVKELIRDDLKRVNDAARVAREKGEKVRDRANAAVTRIDTHFDAELAEIAELESELNNLSNNPPEGVA